MDYRRFFLIVSVILSVFLFAGGTGILLYFSNTDTVTTVTESGEDPENNDLGDIITNLVGSSKKKPINFLVLVGDRWEANTDSIMLVNYNPENFHINILSIPRDTKVEVDGPRKINSVFYGNNGPEVLMNTLSNMLGVNIKYYVYMNLKTIREIVDELGGVWYDVPFHMTYSAPDQNLYIDIPKGKQKLDGAKVEQFLRYRKHSEEPINTWPKEVLKYYDGSDLKRIEMQQKFLKEFARQKITLSNFTKLNDVIDIVFKNLKTNISLNEVLSMLAKLQDFSPEKIFMHTLPGHSIYIDGISYIVCDTEAASALMKEYFSGSGKIAPVENVNTAKPSPTPARNNSSAPDGNSEETEQKTPAETTLENPSNEDTALPSQPSPLP